MKTKMTITIEKVGRTFEATIRVDKKVAWKSTKRRNKHNLLVEVGWMIEREKLL